MQHLLAFTLLYLAASAVQASIDDLIKAAAPDNSAFATYSDGTVRVEYDILYTREQWANIQARKDGTSKRKAEPDEEYRWTDNVIPYEIASGEFSIEVEEMIIGAMRTWEKHVCLTFRPRRSTDKNYIYITTDGGCSSYVGMLNIGKQTVTLGDGCWLPSIILHELGHAIGFEHEQCRYDRDGYITIHLENVHELTQYNFDLKDTDNRNVPYDYSSIMHYGQYAFTSNGQKTIVTIDTAWQTKIGLAYMLSYADVRLANLIYKCGAGCPSCSHYGEDAFADKDCQCRCPGTPAKICGRTGGDDGTEGCEDFDERCDGWASRGYCETTPEHTVMSCPKSCGCGDVSKAPCKDMYDTCDYYKSLGECETAGYMTTECRKTCGFCGNGDTGDSGNPSCTDNDEGCAGWADYGECDRNPGYMHENCAKSCGMC